MRTPWIVSLACVGLLVAHGAAHADEDAEEEARRHAQLERGIKVLVIGEWLLPDLRLQLRDDERLILSWPLQLWHLGLGDRAGLVPFVEPQLQPSTDDVRVLLGARSTIVLGGALDDLAVLLEGAAILGHDLGTGGAVGAGLLLGSRLGANEAAFGIALVYRESIFPDGERRRDISLDVLTTTIFSRAFWGGD